MKTPNKASHTPSAIDIQRYRFLLRSNDLFRDFIPKHLLEQIESPPQSLRSVTNHGSESNVHRSTQSHCTVESEEDSQGPVYFLTSPPFIHGGTMRDYQVEGLNWLISLHHNNINGILADEMGLGKTLQTISLLGYLRECQGVSGPHLLLVPKSTLQNWLNEVNKWLPQAKPFILHGDAQARKQAIAERMKGVSRDFDICITSYEICLIEKNALAKIEWEYIVIDEAHRIKNENSILSQVVRMLHSKHRLLLTGTPLQNNLHELWALLNFLLPDIFQSGQFFDEWFQPGKGEETPLNDSQQAEKVQVEWDESKEPLSEAKTSFQQDSNAHNVIDESNSSSSSQEEIIVKFRQLLEPFLLRRLKVEVENALLPKKEVYLYVGMTALQKRWYQTILQKDISALNGVGMAKGESKTRLANIAMQLRKCCNHPYLFDGAEPGPPFTNDFHLVSSAGKMVLLDKLLAKLKANGSRVLLFSQMSRMLDIFEDYCEFRNYSYCRIDGQTPHEERVEAIEEYNKPASDKFLFLLTTRAGGLGINLTTADIVILYDSDWNPQVDLQAQDRAHRIGQTKQVYVFRFVTEASFEEKVMERALQKLRLDQLVIQQGKAPNASKALSSAELLEMVHYGAQDILLNKERDSVESIDIEETIKKGQEKTLALQSKYSNAGLEDLARMEEAINTPLSQPASNPLSSWVPLELAKRDRKPNTYSVDEYYREALSSTLGSKRQKENAIPKPKLPYLHDFQFVNIPRLTQLFEKETLHFQKQHSYSPEDPVERAKIESAEPLSPEEETEKAQLLSAGFVNWTRREYLAFLRASERYGRMNISAIAEEIEGKTRAEVEAYSKAFWKNFTSLPDWERTVGAIERGEERLERSTRLNKILKRKVAIECSRSCGGWKSIKVPDGCSTAGYNENTTKFLLYCSAKYGADCGDLGERVWEDLRREPLFELDFFLRTRSVLDLGRRIGAVLQAVENEVTKKAEESERAAAAKRMQSSEAIKSAQKSVASLFKIGSILNKEM
jgi:superfamily II DNA or RNA helicase